MYILANKFIGNIENNEQCYLDGNTFYYTNDNISWKHIEVSEDDLFNGDLKEFYTYITIHEWINPKILELAKRYIVKEIVDNKKILRAYLLVRLNSKNELTEVFFVKKGMIKDNIYEPIENIVPDLKGITVFTDGTHSCSMADESPTDDTPLIYSARICLPTMTFHKKIKQYVFETLTFFQYNSVI